MAKGSKAEWFDMTESANWNVAADYVRFKIMKPLAEADMYETIAEFGTAEMGEEFMTSDTIRNSSRIKAIKRLAKSLELVIRNTIFALKKKDVPEFEKYKETIARIRKILHTMEIKTINQRDKKHDIKIDEDKFQRFLEILVDIKEKLNTPLNNADLIFGSVEEWDPEKMKKDVLDQMIRYG